jgi:hypothetical protein
LSSLLWLGRTVYLSFLLCYFPSLLKYSESCGEGPDSDMWHPIRNSCGSRHRQQLATTL